MTDFLSVDYSLYSVNVSEPVSAHLLYTLVSKNMFLHHFRATITRCKYSGLTLNAEALLVLDDEILLVVLELAQIILSVLGHQTKLLKSLVDLLVFLRHAVHHPTQR